MSLYSVDNRIVTVGGKFAEKRVNSLTFEVEGPHFPLNSYNNSASELSDRASFIFKSSTPNFVVINYGDGIVETHNFVEENGKFVFGWRGLNSYMGSPQSYDPGVHTYQDNFLGIRNVTFDFYELKNIVENPIHFCEIRRTPYNWNFSALTSVSLIFTRSLIELKNISTSVISISLNEGVVLQKFTKIPDQWFNVKNIITFDVRETFDFTDPIISNLYKINQWSKLERINAIRTNITELPNSINQLQHLWDLKIERNDFVEIPKITAPKISNISLFGCDKITSSYIPDWNSLNYLKSISWFFLTASVRLDYSWIPLHWKGLKSVNNIYAFTRDDVHFDEFIDNFYTLCTTNGFLDPTSAEAIATGFPNQFRNISWGQSTLTQTGVIQSPSGFVQGVDNGTPANQGEKIYVLKENYGHIITTAQP